MNQCKLCGRDKSVVVRIGEEFVETCVLYCIEPKDIFKRINKKSYDKDK